MRYKLPGEDAKEGVVENSNGVTQLAQTRARPPGSCSN
jgi:hypothetical protein